MSYDGFQECRRFAAKTDVRSAERWAPVPQPRMSRNGSPAGRPAIAVAGEAGTSPRGKLTSRVPSTAPIRTWCTHRMASVLAPAPCVPDLMCSHFASQGVCLSVPGCGAHKPGRRSRPAVAVSDRQRRRKGQAHGRVVRTHEERGWTVSFRAQSRQRRNDPHEPAVHHERRGRNGHCVGTDQ